MNKEANDLHPQLEVTSESSNEKLPFLGIMVIVDKSNIVTQITTKMLTPSFIFISAATTLATQNATSLVVCLE